MIGEGLLDCGEDDDLSFGYLTRLYRPVGIVLGADQYLHKLDEQIKALGKSPPKVTGDGADKTYAVQAHQRKAKGLKVGASEGGRIAGVHADLCGGNDALRIATERVARRVDTGRLSSGPS